MTKAKHNQAKSFFSYKNDDMDLVELGQFLRDTTGYRVEREWYVVFDKRDGNTGSVYCKNIPDKVRWDFRNPDLILIDKKTGKLILIIELDGAIHEKKWLDTQQRNEQYFIAGLPFITLSPLEIKTNIFDLVTKKIGDKLGI